MARPIHPRNFNDPTFRIAAKFHNGSSVVDGYLTRQIGWKTYIATTDGNDSYQVRLIDNLDQVDNLTAGLGYILIQTPSGTQYVTKMYSKTLVTNNNEKFEWKNATETVDGDNQVSMSYSVVSDEDIHMTAAELDGRYLRVPSGIKLIVDAEFSPLSLSNQALPNINMSNVYVDIGEGVYSNKPEDVWEFVEVENENIADKFKLFWISLDQNYYAAPLGSETRTSANLAFVSLGNVYASYLRSGETAILDIVQTKRSGVPNFAERQQSLHENLLNNLANGPINSRFINLDLPDPRTEDGLYFGTRPIFDGVFDSNWESQQQATIDWDVDNNIVLPQ